MKQIPLLSEDTWLELSPRKTYEIYLSLHNAYSELLEEIEAEDEIPSD